MSRIQATLHLVRHGQASATSRDYDVLSPLGATQSRALGEHLAQSGRRFDAIYAGPLVRQRDTAQHLIAAARAAGADFPDAETLPGLDEIPFREIVRHCLERSPEEGRETAALLDGQAAHDPESKRRMARFFRKSILAWAAGGLGDAPVLPFLAFAERVHDTLAQLSARGGELLVLTSAGTIAVALRRAQAPGTTTPEETMMLALAIGNASLTILESDGDALRVVRSNELAHFDPALVTYL
jgi:broad specificity phosphatase PhoE